MSHFSRHALDSDPEGLARLREILHGRSTAARIGRTARTTPTLAERFGIGNGRSDKASTPSRLAHAIAGSR